MKRLAIVSLVLLLCTGLLWAQSDRGTITGTVKDSTGAVIPGVTVTATNVETGVKTTATTNHLGLYTVLNLPIGQYTLTFNKDSFKPFERKGLTLSVNQVADINATLEIGTANEVVVVTEDAPMLDTQSSAVGTTLKQRAILDLPISVADAAGGRQLENFAYATMPGVEGNNWQEHVAGSMTQSKEVLIDGTSAVSQIGGHVSESNVSMEAVEEFQVATTGLRAEDGRTGGGVFRFNLKSGTNDFHGSAFGFIHNEAFNANSWMNKYQLAKNLESKPDQAPFWHSVFDRGRDRQLDYGGSFGGPIFKDKTFFFTAFERYELNSLTLGDYSNTVPTAAFLRGDFSALLGGPIGNFVNPCTGQPYLQGQIFDPETRRTVNGQVCADPFPGNIIPTDRISDVSSRIGEIYTQYYQPLNGDIVRNSARPASINPWFRQNQWSLKMDHNFSDTNRLSGSYIYVRRPRTLQEGGIWQVGTNEGGPLSQARYHKVHSDAIRVSDTHTFSPTVVNVLSATYNRFHNPQEARSATGNWPSQLGLYDSPQGNFPSINFQGDNLGRWMTGIGSASSNQYTANTYYLNNNLTWVKGRHTAKFGADVRIYQMNSHSNRDVVTYNFNANTTGQPRAHQDVANATGYAFASFLLGKVESADWSLPNDLYGRRKAFSLYAQDDWKVTQRLTLNMDLRWDVNGRYHEKYGRWSNYNVDAINPVTGRKGVLEFAQDGSDSFERNQSWLNLAPHIGFAYEVSRKTVLRGSYGLFYAPINLSYWAGVPYGFNPGFVADNRMPTTGNFTPAFDWDENGYPGVTVAPEKNPNFVKWGMVSVDPDSLKPGRIQQFSVDVQQEITSNIRFDVRYVGSRGDRLQSGFTRANQADPRIYGNMLKRGTQWNWITNQAEADAAGVPYPYAGWSGLALYAAFPYPDVASTWGPLFFVGSPLGKSKYDSFQTQVSKRGGNGLYMDVSYTLARSKSTVDSAWQEAWWAGPIQNVDQLEREHNTISPFDQTHVFKGYVAYELPFGNGKALLSGASGLLDKLVSGWTVSTIFKYNSGTPLRVTSSYWYPQWNNVYANMNPNVDLSRQFDGDNFTPDSPETYFDTKAFSNPNYGEFGNAPGYISELRGFGGANEDIGISKKTRMGNDGRFGLELRFELYNAFNRHGFENPITNMADPNFGKVIRAAGAPRTGQLGARFTF